MNSIEGGPLLLICFTKVFKKTKYTQRFLFTADKILSYITNEIFLVCSFHNDLLISKQKKNHLNLRIISTFKPGQRFLYPLVPKINNLVAYHE